MNRNQQLAHRIREVFLNGRWIANTNYKEQIEATGWEQAIQKAGDLNPVAALTFHLDYYLSGVLHAFRTGRLEIHDRYSFDLPPIKNEEDWFALRNRFLQNAEDFARHVESIDDAEFDRLFLNEKYGSLLRNIEAMIEHGYYHLGQIVIIRKLIARNKPLNG